MGPTGFKIIFGLSGFHSSNLFKTKPDSAEACEEGRITQWIKASQRQFELCSLEAGGVSRGAGGEKGGGWWLSTPKESVEDCLSCAHCPLQGTARAAQRKEGGLGLLLNIFSSVHLLSFLK